MPLFQAKMGCKMPRKRGYKNYRSVSFQPNAKQKIPKKQQKNSKIKKIPLWLQFKPKQVGKGCEREKTKIIITFRFNPTRNRKFQKHSKKIKKIKKYRYVFFSSQNRFEKDEKRRK